MNTMTALVIALGCLCVCELLARLRSSLAVVSCCGLLIAVGALAGVGESLAVIEPPIGLGPALVALLGLASLLARPPSWRESREVAMLLETAVLVALCFAFQDLLVVGALWLLSLIPGLRHREQPGISRRPLILLTGAGVLLVGGALAGASLEDVPHPVLYLALILGGALRMGVPPFSPLFVLNAERLPIGRTALVAAGRPSVALLLAARFAFPSAIEGCAAFLQPWAAGAALLAGLQGLATATPRRSLALMASTQSAIILFGLVSPGEAGVFGATVQWAGLGLSLLGLGLLVEAVESRVGRRRARRVRGLLSRAPGMALLFLLFAATLSGFPGTAGFVGEDLIMSAPARSAWLLRGMLLAATALNGITMLRLFARSFLGPSFPPEARGFPPLCGRERLVLGGMALALVSLTFWPAVLR